MEILLVSLTFVLTNLTWFFSRRQRKTHRKVEERRSERALLREYDRLLDQCMRLRKIVNCLILLVPESSEKDRVNEILRSMIDDQSDLNDVNSEGPELKVPDLSGLRGRHHEDNGLIY